MQLFSRKTAILAVSFGAMTALGACGDDVTVTPAPVAPVVISITPANVTLNIGESTNLAVQITGGSGPTLASCTSSNTAVATAAVSGSSCRVTAVASGNVSVTAAASTGGIAAAAVTVAPAAAAISGLQLSPAAASVAVNQSVTIVPTVTKAGSAVAVTYAYASSSATIASVNATTGVVTAVAPGVATITVTATGTGTGFTSTTLTSASTVTVTALPTGLTALNVTPSSLSLAIGGTAQIGATSTQPTGAAAATYTYTSGSAAVATVSSTGVVAAVAPGTTIITVTATSAANTNFAAATLSSAVAVTVSPAAQVALTYVNTAAGTAVDISNVAGQIQVGLNVITNGQNVSSAQVYTCPSSATTCPAAGQAPVAQQTFGAGGAASGTMELSVNTAAFSVNSDWSAASTSFANGQTKLVATITVGAGAATTATSNLAILNMNNVSGWAARHVAPTNTVVLTNGTAWFGGPGATGRGSITVVPVTYEAGRTIASATVAVASTATCGAAITFTGAKPWTLTYGNTFGTATGANATNVICTGNSAAADQTVGAITAAVDQNNVAYASTATAADLKTTTAVTPAVVIPASIRVDYAAPTGAYTTTGTLLASNWINASFAFGSTTSQAALTDGTGAGLGTIVYGYRSTAAATADTGTYATVTTGADIPESTTDLSNNAYKLRMVMADKLGNTATSSSPANFGVDKTAPVIRLTASTDTNGTIYAAVPAAATAADTAYAAEALDERSGFDATAASFTAAKTARATNAGRCWISGAWGATATTTGAVVGASPVTAPTCSFQSTGATLDAALAADGYRPINIPFRAVSTGELANDGYYAVAARVTDKAGNSATAATRYVLNSKTATTATTDALTLVGITATYANPFTGTATDLVEVAGAGLRLAYNAGADVFGFPATATTAISFDNVVASAVAATSSATPFTSGVRIYTTIEKTGAADVVNSATTVTMSGIGQYAFNFAGKGSASTAQVPGTVTADAVTWNTKAAALTAFQVTDGPAAFNSPAGGLKVRATGTAGLLNSPFTRIDYYKVVAGVNEYLGSVDASAAPCTSAALTCGVYVADNGTNRVFTYVLRTFGNPSTGFAASAAPVATDVIVAIGTTGTSGRGLMSAPFTIVTP